MPIVSVIIPAYNVAPFIGETLTTVFAQTFNDYEVIVINDGSPDTEEFERALQPFIDRINYIKQGNRGAGAARNAGLRSARGEFIAFLDADDLWLSNYLEEQLKFIREHDCDLICADAIHFGNSPFAGRSYTEVLMPTAPPTGTITFLGLVSAEQSLITSGVVARRQPIFDVGLFDENLRNSQDFDLWLRLVHGGAQLRYQRRVLLRYRSHESSLSGNEVNRITRQLLVLEKVETEFDLEPAARKEASRAIACRRAVLQFELGKIHLKQGEFDKAHESFANARSASTNWKTLVAFWTSNTCPRLIQAIYLRRIGKAHRKLASG